MAAKSKNVIVFTTYEVPYAIELGWIREVFTIGHVTPVPQAPGAVAGVVNFRGSIVSVVDIRGLRTSQQARASQGESALLVEVDRVQLALRAGTIDEVSSLGPSAREGYLLDSRGREVELLQPEQLFESLRFASSQHRLETST